jgi:hypothetical protein
LTRRLLRASEALIDATPRADNYTQRVPARARRGALIPEKLGMSWITDLLTGVDWNSPLVLALTGLVMILAIMRKWFLVAMTLLVITLGRGLCSLQISRGSMTDSGLTLATIVYVAGSIIVITFAAVDFFVRE